MPRNVVVAQSGGPSPVINNSLRGIVETCREMPETFGRIYGGWHGIEGVLKEELIDLSAQDDEEIALLRTTPAAGSIGTCRYKLRPENREDFERVIDVFRAHDVGYFLYIGGNDSMDTADKVSRLAHERGLDLVAVGVPKTIDNDVGDSRFRLIDHTPGYGSTARYWMNAVANANEENAGSSPADPVLVMQAMGRRIGFIPAAARLADPKRELPLLIFLAESGGTLEQIADCVNDRLRRDGRCLVVVSEGLRLDSGTGVSPVGMGEVRDSFGHVMFSSSQMQVGQIVVNYLNRVGLKAAGAARVNIPGTDQRSDIIHASTVDLDEAYRVGQKAALLAAAGETGYMATILRDSPPSLPCGGGTERSEGSGQGEGCRVSPPVEIYNVRYDRVPLQQVANSERAFPQDWIAADGTDVTDDFVRYARPLVGEDWVSVPLIAGRQRHARLKRLFAEKRLPAHVPVALRGKPS